MIGQRLWKRNRNISAMLAPSGPVNTAKAEKLDTPLSQQVFYLRQNRHARRRLEGTMMNDTMPDTTAPTPKPRSSSPGQRWVRMGFVVVVIVVVGALSFKHRSMPAPRGWTENLNEALHQARTEGRKTVVLFVDHPIGYYGRKLIQTTLRKPGNRNAIVKGQFVAVMVRLKGKAKKDLMAKYKLSDLPTLLLLDPRGKELNRREGDQTLPEVPFRNEFLKGQ